MFALLQTVKNAVAFFALSYTVCTNLPFAQIYRLQPFANGSPQYALLRVYSHWIFDLPEVCRSTYPVLICIGNKCRVSSLSQLSL